MDKKKTIESNKSSDIGCRNISVSETLKRFLVSDDPAFVRVSIIFIKRTLNCHRIVSLLCILSDFVGMIT